MKKMMSGCALWAALSCMIPAPVFAAADIDLLSFDQLPAARPLAPDPVPAPSDAPPLVVTIPDPATSPEVAAVPAEPKPLPPVDVAPPASVKAVPKPLSKAPAKIHVAPPEKPPVKAAIKPPAEVAKTPVIPAAAPVAEKPPEKHPIPPPVIAPASLAKPIAAGDRLVVAVAGETDLSGTYQVMPDGTVVLPVVGSVRAQGFTPDKFAEILTDTLKDGYLVDPKITITTTGPTSDTTGTAP